jgi:hypothetical protein
MNRPLPGRPFAKVEYNRCKMDPDPTVVGQRTALITHMESAFSLFRVKYGPASNSAATALDRVKPVAPIGVCS